MKTTVHCGAPSAKRNEEMFRPLMEEFDPLQPSTLYLVAGRFRRRQLEARFLAAHPNVFEIPVLTLSELTRALSRGYSPVSRRIDESGKIALLEEILDADGLHLGQPDFRNGALPYISQFVAFIKSRNISDPEMLALRYRKSHREPSPLERELITLFGRYQVLLREKGLEDAEDEQVRVYTGLLTGSLDVSVVFPGLRRILVEGIYRLSPLEAGVLRLLCQAAHEVEVSIGGLQLPQFDPSRSEWDFLDGPGVQWVRHDPVEIVEPRFSRPATRAEEVSALARQIVELGERGARLEDVAVVCPSPGRYRDLIDEAFGDFGIPFHHASGTPVSESPSAALFLKYLRVVGEDFSSASLFDFFNDPRIRIPGLSVEALRHLERVVVKSGVDGETRWWVEEFPTFLSLCADQVRRSRPEKAVQLEAAAEVFLSALNQLRPGVASGKPFAHWREELLTLLRPFWVAPEEAGSCGAADNRLFHEFWSQLASACFAASSDRLFSFREFKTLAERQFDRARLRLDKEEKGVVVASPRDLQQASFSHLFWIGLAEGEFPESANQHIFFDDVRSSQWGFANWEERLEESRWLFSSLNASAGEGLYLSCPLKSGDAPMVPSAFWRGLQTETGCHPGAEAETEGSTEFQFHLSTEAMQNARRGIAVQWLRESGGYSPFQGFLGDSRILARFREELFRDSLEISPSQLENYVRCGFRYFAEKVLRLVPVDEPTTEITPRERGNLIHAILFRFVAEIEEPRGFSEETRQAWTTRQRLRMRAILDQELARLRLEKLWHDELFWTHEEKLLAQGLSDGAGGGLLAEFIDQQWERLRTHRFEAVELRVGPVDLGVLGDLERARLVPVRLRGKVDRLDSGPRGLFVVDYKTGQDQLPRVYQGWGFQLPLYLFMLRHLRGEPVEGAAFYTIQAPDEVRLREVVALSPDGDPKAGLDRLVAYYQDKAMEAARSLFDGRFPVTLLGPSNAGCRVCPLSGVCRYDPSAVEPARRSGQFPIDEPIVLRGRWIEEAQPSTSGVPAPV